MDCYEIVDGNNLVIDDTVKIGKNVKIYSGNILTGNTIIGDNVVLLPNNYICDSEIGDNTEIGFSHIEGSIIGNQSKIGPYSRLRKGSIVGNNCKIGNFVEIKNSKIGDGTKASHLTYIGDAEIGKDCNIGCGVVFVNYNGKEKNKSFVGDNTFIGSNVNVIAPVNIASESYICAGTTITVDTVPNDFVIGRVRETVKHNYQHKYKKDK
jgi:bifunctional UDP-N-acetylglucosamine pyrophosphorylase/glucosamine-1-phosphate N-acetyltransferase